MHPDDDRSLVLLAFATVYLIWGSTYFAIRVGLESFPPFLLAALRYLLAGVPLFLWSRRRHPAVASARDWAIAIGLGALLLVGGNGLVTWAEERVPSGIAALLIATVPLAMATLDALLFSRRNPPRAAVVGLLLGVTGVVVLVDPFSGGGALEPFGAGLLLVASLSWALGSLLGRRVASSVPALRLVAMEMIGGGSLLAVISLLRGEWSRFEPAAISFRSGLALAFLAIFGSLAALTAYLYLLRVRPPHVVASYAFVNPIVALVLGTVFAHEPLGLRAVVAAGLVLGAVILLHRSQSRSAKAAAEVSVGRPSLVMRLAGLGRMV